ncbi:MAG TPA: FAD-dependent oxidoreductase [Armatimonadaceae bacterium]|nr:FAD-dependent oxidoreductase [Armatimonadaceae bacterium]
MPGRKHDRRNYEAHEADVCVIGGGMAGMCAALAAARGGAKTVLIHDRPVLGGNASSEVRMWICGAHGQHNKEAGILEEVQLENLYHNPGRGYSVWDAVLWGKVRFQPNLTPLLNCSCTDAEMDGDAIVGVTAWQLTSQTWHTVRAKQYVDCSGDSILAAVTSAEFRAGREARAEFDEDIEPREADHKTMGNSLLIQLRRTDDAQPYTAPPWAYKFTSPGDLPHRIRGVNGHNFWWIEIGGLGDTIRDAEAIRDELMRVGYGVWDYIKNHAPERAQAENWALEWVGSLPGKRENRRYVGDHVLTQNDVRDGGRFADTVAYGGWSMDDHHPAGIYYPGKPTIFHPAPSPYGIPYRSLYSKNVANLLFAGRNISVTHAALSSTRVMGTCAILGQAAGTAAALCARHGCAPRALSSGDRLAELQRTLMDDDCWLPGLARRVSDLACAARLESEAGRDPDLLRDGLDRDRENETHAWVGGVGKSHVAYRWDRPVNVAGVRLVFDSDLNNDKRMAHVYPQNANRRAVPGSLVRRFRLEARGAGGSWETVYRAGGNRQRLVRVALPGLSTDGLRLVPEETWAGGDEARVFAFEPQAPGEFADTIPAVPDGPHFGAVVARIPAADLAPPDSGLEEADGGGGRASAA